MPNSFPQSIDIGTIFAYDLDGTIYPNCSFIPKTIGKLLDEKQKNGFFPLKEGSMISELLGTYLVTYYDQSLTQEQYDNQASKDVNNFKEVIQNMLTISQKKIPQYIVTFNRNRLKEINFVPNLFESFFSAYCALKKMAFSNPIEQDHVFDFIVKPGETLNQYDEFYYIQNHGKNPHLVMTIIDQIHKYLNKDNDLMSKHKIAMEFISWKKGTHQEKQIFKLIDSNLKNVYFFDDDPKNITLAKEFGFEHAYLINPANDIQTLNKLQIKAISRIATEILLVCAEQEFGEHSEPQKSSPIKQTHDNENKKTNLPAKRNKAPKNEDRASEPERKMIRLDKSNIPTTQKKTVLVNDILQSSHSRLFGNPFVKPNTSASPSFKPAFPGQQN